MCKTNKLVLDILVGQLKQMEHDIKTNGGVYVPEDVICFQGQLENFIKTGKLTTILYHGIISRTNSMLQSGVGSNKYSVGTICEYTQMLHTFNTQYQDTLHKINEFVAEWLSLAVNDPELRKKIVELPKRYQTGKISSEEVDKILNVTSR